MTTKAQLAFIGLGTAAFLAPFFLHVGGGENLAGPALLMNLGASLVFIFVMMWKRQRHAYLGVAWFLLTFLSAAIIPDIDSRSPAQKDAWRKVKSALEDRRQAKSIVAIYHEGAEAGVVWAGKTRQERIRAVCIGQESPADEALPGRRYGMPGGWAAGPGSPGRSFPIRSEAFKHVGMDAKGDLFYDEAGGHPALPAITPPPAAGGKFYGSFSDERSDDRSYAQSVVHVYRAGANAGVVWAGTTRKDRIDAVSKGQAPDGAASGKRFWLPLHSRAQRTRVAKYIGMDANGDLFYDDSGKQAAL